MKRPRLWLLAILLPLAIIAILTLTLRAHADSGVALHPPKGAKLALAVFEDLECPECARANPMLEQAARTYNIPLMRYDFPLPQHEWSFEAAVLARYFDTQSPKLGNAYRDYMFAHQQEITKANLHEVTNRWAQTHNTSLPFVLDPQGKLTGEVRADQALGQRIGINHTPTIYVVSSKQQGTPSVEVVDLSQLYQMIDAMKAEAK